MVSKLRQKKTYLLFTIEVIEGVTSALKQLNWKQNQVTGCQKLAQTFELSGAFNFYNDLSQIANEDFEIMKAFIIKASAKTSAWKWHYRIDNKVLIDEEKTKKAISEACDLNLFTVHDLEEKKKD